MVIARLACVGALLAASGTCALIYQITWLRELRLVFGSTTSASAAVVAIFMGGLGIGNAFFGKRADSHKNPLALYALLEAVIAAAAAISPWFIDLTRDAYIQLGGQLALGEWGAAAIRLALSAAILLFPTILMGGTLPAAIASMMSPEDRHRRALAVLYGANTLGGVCGALISTFVALPVFGTRWTLWSACLANGVVAASAWRISRHPDRNLTTVKVSSQKSAKQHSRRLPVEEAIGHLPPPLCVYSTAGVVGLAFLLMELVWYRMLAPILGGTTYTFGLILSVALLGIGVGGACYPVLFRRRRPDLQTLAATCGLEAALMAIPLALGDRLALAAGTLHNSNHLGFPGEVAGWTAIAAVVVLPASIVSGVQFPVLIALLGRGEKDVGAQVGWTYAWNTLGAIVGSLAGGFGLLPLLSAIGTWKIVVCLLAVLSVMLAVIALRSVPQSRVGLTTFGWGVIAVLLLNFTGPTAVWRQGGIGAGRASFPADRNPNGMRAWENQTKREVVWEADGVEAGVAIIVNNGVSFVVNGKVDGNAVGDAATQIWLGMLPALLHPSPRTCMVVGLGSGETGGWLAGIPDVQRVDIVEIEPLVNEMAQRCAAVNGDVLNNPKVRIIHNDAREVLLTTRDQYDLIASEPSNPYRAGIASLFTREFYAAVRGRLNSGGLFVQWLQGYEIDETTVYTVLATLKSEFSHVEVWQSKHDDLLLVCSQQPFQYTGAQLRARIAEQPYRKSLAAGWHTERLEGLLAHYVAGQPLVDAVAREYSWSVNTDDLNRIEYGFARTLGKSGGFSVAMLREKGLALGSHRPVAALDGVDWDAVEDERLAMYAVLAQVVSTRATADAARAARSQALERYLASDWAGTITAWDSQTRSPSDPTTTVLIALALAECGDDRAQQLADKHRKFSPTESRMIEGILFWRQGRNQAAADALEAALVGLRTEPWTLLEATRRAVRASIELAETDSEIALRLLRALSEPFSAMYEDDLRKLVACLISAQLSPELALPWFDSFEPYPVWTETFLQMRADVYRGTRHPLTGKARADLNLLRSNETR